MAKNKSKKNLQFPDDSDGDALRSLCEDGIDFSKVHTVDFFVVAENEEVGNKLKPVISEAGFWCNLERDEELEEWTINCSKNMKLDYHEVVETQKLLNELCKPLGGFCDGWGTFGEGIV